MNKELLDFLETDSDIATFKSKVRDITIEYTIHANGKTFLEIVRYLRQDEGLKPYTFSTDILNAAIELKLVFLWRVLTYNTRFPVITAGGIDILNVLDSGEKL